MMEDSSNVTAGEEFVGNVLSRRFSRLTLINKERATPDVNLVQETKTLLRGMSTPTIKLTLVAS